MKNKTLKSMFSMLLVLCLLVCCAACSGGESVEKENPTSDISKTDAIPSKAEQSYDESLLVEPGTQNEVQIKSLAVTSENGISVSANTQCFTNALKYSDFNGQSGTMYRAYKGNINNFPKVLNPVSSTLLVSKTLPSFYSVSLDNADTEYAYLSSTPIPFDVNSDYIAFDIFVKSDKDQKIYWGNDGIVSFDGNKDILTYTRVAVINCGTVAEGATSDAVLSAVPSNSLENRVVMYEPASTTHTNSPGYAGKDIVPDLYISSAFSNLKAPVKTAENGNKYIDVVQHAQYSSSASGTRATDNNKATNAFFNAQAGVNRIRVYVWLEGNDVDCENAVASNLLDINLKFATK